MNDVTMIHSITTPKHWHCYNSRSLPVLWALEELGIDYDLKTPLMLSLAKLAFTLTVIIMLVMKVSNRDLVNIGIPMRT